MEDRKTLYKFAGNKSTLEDIVEILDTYSMRDIDTLMRQRALSVRLMMRLQTYFLTRAMRDLLYTKKNNYNG